MASVEPEVGVSESVFGLPAPPLRSLMAWYSGYLQAGTRPAVHRGLPSPYLTLIVSLWEPLAIARHPTPQQTPGQFETLAGGLHTSPALIVHQGWQSGIRIALNPLGARALLRVPAAEIAHIDVDSDLLLGPAALEMSERAREANTWRDRLAVVDEVLGRLLQAEAAPRIEVTSAWRHIVSSNGSISVDRLARMAVLELTAPPPALPGRVRAPAQGGSAGGALRSGPPAAARPGGGGASACSGGPRRRVRLLRSGSPRG